jgi:hypothetical protein
MPIIQIDKKQCATNDQVVSGALKFLFQNDSEFAPWFEAHRNDVTPQRGRRKRSVSERRTARE